MICKMLLKKPAEFGGYRFAEERMPSKAEASSLRN